MAQAGEFRFAVLNAGSEENLRGALIEWRKRLGSWGAVADRWGVSRITMVKWRKRLKIEEKVQ